MKILIVGAGAVGSIVASRLSRERHDVTLIESDDRMIAAAQRSLDALVIPGNGASLSVLEKAGVEGSDVMIAVTNADEINILACQQAHRMHVPTKLARVRNTDYYIDDQPAFDGVDAMINPDRVAVDAIRELLLKKAATDFYEFADGRVQVIGARVGAGSMVMGKSLREIEQEVGSRWALVASITRHGKTIIPCGEDVLEEDDQVFLVGRSGKIESALQYIALPSSPVERVMIVGANRIGINLANELSHAGVHVKLIEADAHRAQRASTRVDDALVLHAEATDLDVLRSEGIESMHGFVAASEDEELNLTAALLAKHHGARKTICLLKRPNYVPLSGIIGIDAAVSPRLSTAEAIMRYFRTGNVLSLTTLRDSAAEILELEASKQSAVTDRPLAELEFPRGALIGAIIKPYQVVIPRGGDVIEEGDKVLVFTVPSVARSVQKLFG
jgi:trk system potassium uptake protein TrkA